MQFLACDFPPAIGGIQKLTHGLCRALVTSGQQVQVFATRQPDDKAFDANSGVPTVRCRGGALLTPIAVGSALRRASSDGRTETAVIATKWRPEGHAYLMLGSRRTRPMILMGHGREFRPDPGRRLRAAAQRIVLRAAAGAIVNSRYTRSQMVAAGMREDRIRVVHPGVDPGEFAPPPDPGRARRELRWPDGPTLLTVARLVRRKGLDTVIEALPAIAGEVPDVEYAVIGDGPDRARLTQLARTRGLESRVHFMGAVNEEQKAACLHLCDLFVMPSRDIPSQPPEGFGIVYLEANVCGKPVVATRTGGVEDAVENGVTGLLVDPDSPDQVAEAAVRLLKEPRLAETMGEQGWRRALESFSWDVIAPQFVEAVRSLL